MPFSEALLERGLLGILFVLTCIVIMFLYKENKDERQRNRDLQEKRLEENKTALTSVVQAVGTVQAAIDVLKMRSRR